MNKLKEVIKEYGRWAALSTYVDRIETHIEIDFSHSLRKFRNFIHPYQQHLLNFSPDKHTAKISWQVLQAVIDDLSKKKVINDNKHNREYNRGVCNKIIGVLP